MFFLWAFLVPPRSNPTFTTMTRDFAVILVASKLGSPRLWLLHEHPKHFQSRLQLRGCPQWFLRQLSLLCQPFAHLSSSLSTKFASLSVWFLNHWCLSLVLYSPPCFSNFPILHLSCAKSYSMLVQPGCPNPPYSVEAAAWTDLQTAVGPPSTPMAGAFLRPNGPAKESKCSWVQVIF